MSEENKNLVRQYIHAIWDLQDMAAIEQYLSPDFVQHNRGVQAGRDGVKGFFMMLRSAFPDVQNIVEDMIAEGDRVFWRATVRGTQTGPFQKIPPTGKQVAIATMNIVRVANGKIVENWGEVDNLGLLQQLGVAPAPGSGH